MACEQPPLRLDALHRYWTGPRELLAVTQVLALAGVMEATWWTPESRARGQQVHRATEALDRHEPVPEVDAPLAPYIEAYQAFVHDTRPVWHGIEQPAADLRLGYAGTPDRWGTLQGEAVVVDLKTGSVPAWAPLQLVAYARLDLVPTHAARRRRLVVQLRPTGRYQLREYPVVNFGRDERIFLSALTIAQWKRAA